MEINTSFAILLGVLATICTIIFGYSNWRRAKCADDQKDGKQDGTILTEIGYIKSGVDDIKRKQEKAEEQHIEVITRLAIVETSTASAHARINSIEENKRNKGQYDGAGLK